MARNIFKGLDRLIEGYHTEEGRRKPKKQIKEVKTRTEIRLGDKVYPIKDREFLKGKVAGYGNEYGLEHVRTVKYSDGTSYKIYDSGFDNFGHVDSCAVLDEKLKGDVPPKGYEKPTSVKGDWIWDEVRYDWYDRKTGSYYADIERRAGLKEALYGKKEIDDFFLLCDKLGLKTFGDLQNFADTNRNRIIVNNLLKDYDLSMSTDAFFETLRDRVKELPKDDFEYDDPLNVIKNRNRNESLDDNNTKNSIEVEVKSGINGDGFKVVVKDVDGNIIEQEDFHYGYNASYNKSWADKNAPFVTDIINSYLSKYNLSKDDLVLTKGKNVFRDKDISDETIARFKTDYLSESKKGYIEEDFLFEAISSKDISEYCDTPLQEDTLKLINRIAKREGVSLRIGTKVGKYPQSLIVDNKYQDNAIRIYPNGACSINDKKFGDWQLGYGHINIDEFKKGVTSAIKEMSPIKENKSFDDDYKKAWAYEVYRVLDGEVLATGGRKRSYEIAVKYAEETAQAYEEQGYGECDYDVFEDTDLTPMWNRKKTIYESKKLTEGHEQYDYKGFSIDLDDDQFHNIKRHGSGNIAVEVKIGDTVYATVNGYDAAEEWIDKNGQKILDEIEAEKKRKEEVEQKKNEKRQALRDMLSRINSTNDFYDYRKDSDPGISKSVHLDLIRLGKLLKLGNGNHTTRDPKGIPVTTKIKGIDLFANIWDEGDAGYELSYGLGAYADSSGDESLENAFNGDARVFIYRNIMINNMEEVNRWLDKFINNADSIAKDLIDEEWRASGFENYDSIFESFNQEGSKLIPEDISAAEALVQEDYIKIKDLSSVKEIQKDDEQTWADKEYSALMKKGKPNWDESDWETYHYIQQLRFDSGYYSESLKEEYGPYEDNEIIRAIGDQIADGNDYGSAYDRDWELTIYAEGGEVIENENISSDFYSRLLADISYPVLDGHLNYYGLNIILWGVPATKEELEFLGFTDEDIERYLKAEDFEEEIETWIDYEITYDGPDIRDELYADEDFDDDTLYESKKGSILSKDVVEEVRSEILSGLDLPDDWFSHPEFLIDDGSGYEFYTVKVIDGDLARQIELFIKNNYKGVSLVAFDAETNELLDTYEGSQELNISVFVNNNQFKDLDA